MEKEADLKVTALQNGNLVYEWWCELCKIYHYPHSCPLLGDDNSYNDDYFRGSITK